VDINTRPRPILDKVKTVGGAVAAIGGLVSWAGAFGLLNVTQTAASSALLGLVPGIVTAVLALLSAFGVAKAAEPLVTPMTDPRNDAGVPLLPQQASADSGVRRRKDLITGEDASTF
jgi:hypothetical protein